MGGRSISMEERSSSMGGRVPPRPPYNLSTAYSGLIILATHKQNFITPAKFTTMYNSENAPSHRNSTYWTVRTRGGVEDTKLEAKAKDTKKSEAKAKDSPSEDRPFRGQGQGHKKIRGQGQGQPFRGQTLSRPRTGMLETKAKNQGHSASALQKKIFFSGNLQKKGLQKNFC